MVQWYQNSLMQWSCRFGLSLNIPATSDLFDLSLPAVGTPSQKTHGEGGILLWQVGGLWCLRVVSDPKWIFFFSMKPRNSNCSTAKPCGSWAFPTTTCPASQRPSPAWSTSGSSTSAKMVRAPNPEDPKGLGAAMKFYLLVMEKSVLRLRFPAWRSGEGSLEIHLCFFLKKQSFLQHPVPCWLVPSWE